MKLPIAIAALLVTCIVPATAARAESTAEPSGATAAFGRTTIDLGQDWGEAKACLVSDGGTECFASEKQLDTALAVDARSAGRAAAPTCSTSLRLYAGTSYSSTVLAFTVRGSWKNLSAYGFDNKTRSYKVGACAGRMAGGTSGGGGLYPGSTAAGASAATMASGWDRKVSSVYLY